MAENLDAAQHTDAEFGMTYAAVSRFSLLAFPLGSKKPGRQTIEGRVHLSLVLSIRSGKVRYAQRAKVEITDHTAYGGEEDTAQFCPRGVSILGV